MIYRIWRPLALIIISLALFASNLRTLQQAWTHNPNALVSDQIAPAEIRTAKLAPWLPKHGRIGYLSDITDASTYFRRYYSTQYALAPLMFIPVGQLPSGSAAVGQEIIPNQELPSMILADIHDPAMLTTYLNQMQLEVVAEADGLYLLRQRSAAQMIHGGSL